MSHFITTVNNNAPSVTGAIVSGVNDFQYLLIGSDTADNFVSSFGTYPRALAAGDEFLWNYKSNYYFNNITGLTINDYSTDYAKSFTLPAGSYLIGYNIVAYTSPSTTSGGIRCTLTDGTTVYSGSTSCGRNTYAVYNSAKQQCITRITLASSTTIYVKIDTEIGTALFSARASSMCIIKEG